MASSRKKPELEGLDAILPAQSTDLVSSVIASDRKRAGRGEFRDAEGQDYDTMTSPMTIGQADTQADKSASPMADTSADKPVIGQSVKSEDIQHSSAAEAAAATTTGEPTPGAPVQTTSGAPESRPATEPRRSKPAPPPRPSSVGSTRGPSELVERRRSAATAAASRTMTVTLRLPQAMNDWLDEYVHQSWPSRVKKQELVVEALRMLIARRGRAGAPVLPTELLDDD